MQPTKAGSVSAGGVSVDSLRRTLQAWDAFVIHPKPRCWIKRSFDVLVSGLGLLGSAPLWGLIALSITLDTGFPVFYRQARVGKGGTRFTSWKFRSMAPDADVRFGPLQAGADDPRVTRVGRWLRATALDELPQLWNIFRGDMSFVGPRALMPEEIELRATLYAVPGALGDHGGEAAVPLAQIPGYAQRHTVTPGLTGLAQIYADRDIPRRQKFKYDLLYIKTQSLWLDLRLMALSLWITFHGRWEQRSRKW
jgi:lipopolysaccharide/colanic/teichoic acid biosynthesis glycosyltransferase